MRFVISEVGRYTLLSVEDTVSIISELSSLMNAIEELLTDGKTLIAVRFTDASYLYSGAISVLISCYRMIKDKNGDLSIVESHKRIYELLKQMSIDRLISIHETLEELRIA